MFHRPKATVASTKSQAMRPHDPNSNPHLEKTWAANDRAPGDRSPVDRSPVDAATQFEPAARTTGEASRLPESPHRVLWIDGIGGFLMCDKPEILLGQAAPGNEVDLPIVGDLSRRAASIRRSGEDHLLQPLHSPIGSFISLDGVSVDRASLLRNGMKIQIGDRVLLQYRRPSRLSGSARLDLISHHRWQPHVDGVLLLADSCLIGPSNNSHIVCPQWSQDVVLFRSGDDWYCRNSDDSLVTNDHRHDGPVKLTPGVRISGNDFSMCLE